MAAPYGDGQFTIEPPSGNGLNITDLFHIVEPTLDDPTIYSRIDSRYPNVAVITFDTTNQFGGMWAKEKLDLNMPFSTEMYLHLGHQYGNNSNSQVADGMTFTMHNDPGKLDAIGGAGEGLGVYKGRRWTGEYYQGNPVTVEHRGPLKNALVVEFDTYRNTRGSGSFVIDPPGVAHCALLIPKNNTIDEADHKNIFTFTPSRDWVPFMATWTPDQIGGGMLEYSFGGTSRQYSVDNVISVFGSTKVYWGFTGATGQLTSVQAVAITKLPLQGVVAEKTVKNAAGDNIDRGTAMPGDILNYTIRVTAQTLSSSIGPVVINDFLSELVEYDDMADVRVTTSLYDEYTVRATYTSDVMSVSTNQSLAKEGDWIEIKFSVKVKENTTGQIVYNSAEVSAPGLSEPQQTNVTQVSIFATVEKKISDYSEAGKAGVAVKVGDRITYEIVYANDALQPAVIEITDDLPEEVDFVMASNGGTYNDVDHTVTWNLTGVPGNTSSFVTLVVRVNESAIVKIENQATIIVNGGTPADTNIVENLVAPVAPEKKVSDGSKAGKNGASVKLGDEINYEISYRNNQEAVAEITITDKLPTGVDFVDAGPSGTYTHSEHTVTWTLQNIASGASGTVSLTVRVNEKAVKRIVNYATVKVGGGNSQDTNNVINRIWGTRCENMKKSTSCRAVIKGQKIWIDNNNIGNTRPSAIEIILLRDNEVYYSIDLDSSGDGTFTFACLPRWENSEHEYEYKVDEARVPEGYIKTINGYNITNRLI